MHQFLEHLHNAIVHFPIVLAYGALVLALWGLRDRRARTELRWVLLVGALFAVLAYFTGERAEERAEARGIAEQLLELHERGGILTAALFVLSALLAWAESFARGLRHLALVSVLLLSASVTYTGYLGGQIAHPLRPSVQDQQRGEGGEGGGGHTLLPGGEEADHDHDELD